MRGQLLGRQQPLTSQVLQRRQSSRQRLVTTAAFHVRPYTVRKGDTLASIARKRGVQGFYRMDAMHLHVHAAGISDIRLDELQALNHDINPDSLVEQQTILIPAGKLSQRDRNILSGISTTTYRTYPVREGETLEDIISRRNISRAEMEALNPGVNLDQLSQDLVIKLPAGKYTVREREMMTGSGLVPAEFFDASSALSKFVIGGIAAAAIYSLWLWRQRSDRTDDE